MVKVIPTDLLEKAMFYQVPGTVIRVYIQPNYSWDTNPFIQEIDDSHEDVKRYLDSLVNEKLIELNRSPLSAEEMMKRALVKDAAKAGIKWPKGYVEQSRLEDLRVELSDALAKLREKEKKKLAWE